MKYKIGDVVKLKSADELMKLGTWYKPRAEECGGKSYKIEEFVGNSYRSENIIFDEENIECLVHTYTFDELKKRVDELKDYLLEYTSNTNQLIEVRLYRGCLGDRVYANIEIKD